MTLANALDGDGNPIPMTFQQCVKAVDDYYSFWLVINGGLCWRGDSVALAAARLEKSQCQVPCPVEGGVSCGTDTNFLIYTIEPAVPPSTKHMEYIDW